MARPITGTIYYPNGTAWANGTVRARLMEPFETSTRVYPKTEITITLDSNGQIPALTQLDTPDTGTAHYVITTPDNAQYTVYLETGAAVDLVTLLTIAGTAVAQDDLQTLLDAAEVFDITTVSSGPYAVLATDDEIRFNGTFTVTLPAATGSGRPLALKNIGTGTITITPDGTDTIDGFSSVYLYQRGGYGLIDGATGRWDLFGG